MRNFQTIVRSLPIAIGSSSWLSLCLLTAAVFIVSPLPVFAQSAPASSPSAAPSQTQSNSQAQSQSQSQTSAQTDSTDKPDSLADAARKAKAQAQKNKPAAKPAHVFTDDNISSVGGTISVVGDGSSSSGGNSSAVADDNSSSSGNSDEATWRQRAAEIKSRIADVDRQIDQTKAEISKQGGVAFDPQAGLSQGVIVIHDRNADLKNLEDQKASLEKQLDDLADEARKAGADPGWVR